MKLVKFPQFNKKAKKPLPMAINAEEVESIKIRMNDSKTFFKFEITMKSGRKIISEGLADPGGEQENFKEAKKYLNFIIEKLEK